MEKRDILIGQGAVLLTAFLWSTSGLFIKLLIEINWHPMLIAGSRSFLAAIFLLIIRLVFPPPKNAKKSSSFPLWAGAFAYAITMLSFIYANSLTTAANAIMLQYTAPVWAALLGWYFNREKPHWEHWLSIALVGGGLFLFFGDALESGALLGNSIAIFSGLAFGATSVFMRMMKDGNPRDAMLLSHVITFAFSIPFFFLYPPEINTSSILPVSFMGIIQIGLASLVYSYGIKKISAVQAMLTAIIEPILNPVWVLLVTGESPSLAAIMGGGIIIFSVVLSSLIGLRRYSK